MWTWDREILALVVDSSHAVGMRIDALLAIEYYGVVSPRGLEEFVQDFDVFLGLCVTLVVLYTVS